MSPTWKTRLNLTNSFPRVSGDEPEYQELGTLLGAFSPRERG